MRPSAGWMMVSGLAAATAMAAAAVLEPGEPGAAPGLRLAPRLSMTAPDGPAAAAAAGNRGDPGAPGDGARHAGRGASPPPGTTRPPPPPPQPPSPEPPGDGGPFPPSATPAVCADGAALAAAEVDGLVRAAAGADVGEGMTVAVVDRAGRVLALFRKAGADPADGDRAVGLARTGAFFSNDQAPLSSRTVRFISGIHFPPGIERTPNAALYGIENTNRGCSLHVAFNQGKAVPPAGSLAGGACQGAAQAGCGTGPVTGKADPFDSDPGAVDPGGLPVFRGGAVVGGIGVTGVFPELAEFAAFTAIASGGFLPAVAAPGVVFIDGVRLPFVRQTRRPDFTSPGSPAGAYALGPLAGGCAPDGYLVGPAAGSRLAAAEVDRIVQQAITAAGRTRAAIRLPLGSRTRMAIAVGDLDGRILALYRMPDATVFSIDVAAAKARNVVYFSAGTPSASADLPGVPAGTAVSNRTLSFGSQPFYPPGIDGSGPGPFFALLEHDRLNPCTQGSQQAGPDQNGVVFFPGSLPLYRGGALVGGLGVSGDGVEQDDYVSFLGAQGFVPPEEIWADRVFIGGVHLPFLKFPRNPER
ncbi:MAG TPA: heme-binding protein [Thermoanaerobaculia bacterium]|nr:heme-binding protein [Thermoanaerobaculia bacterium]